MTGNPSWSAITKVFGPSAVLRDIRFSDTMVGDGWTNVSFTWRISMSPEVVVTTVLLNCPMLSSIIWLNCDGSFILTFDVSRYETRFPDESRIQSGHRCRAPAAVAARLSGQTTSQWKRRQEWIPT